MPNCNIVKLWQNSKTRWLTRGI